MMEEVPWISATMGGPEEEDADCRFENATRMDLR